MKRGVCQFRFGIGYSQSVPGILTIPPGLLACNGEAFDVGMNSVIC
jgi:hypothetical protein